MTESPNLLQTINSPEQLRGLSVEQLPQLCGELREYIISNLCSNPGHFASSMGAVELTVALHYVYDTPLDHLIWDVGHQAYAHKILTGRRDAFPTLRKFNGLSGFPTPKESSSDTFMAGHASNSISAALGYAIADHLNNEADRRKTVAIIGDASISGGLAFEGLNNASNTPNNLLIVLNDNDMSIDDNVGALHRYLMQLNTSKRYNRLRHRTYQRFKKLGILTDRGRGLLLRFNNSIKSLLSGKQNIFEGLNIRYFGPIDGHDVKGLVKVLREIKDMEGPRLLHIKTVKGKGFAPAEKDPAKWHAPGRFDPSTGERNARNKQEPLWQEVFGRYLVELAGENNDIVGITAAMPSGTSMSEMMEVYPERTFDVGISEGHAVTFAGGLAAGGKHPFVAIYSSFLQRAYDNIIHDVAIAGHAVTFCIDRAGIVGEDGVTHHGMFDLAYLRVIPGLTIASPVNDYDLRSLMLTAASHRGPVAIRYPRGKSVILPDAPAPAVYRIGEGRTLIGAPESEIGVITIGPAANDARKAIREIEEEQGVKIALYDALWLKPLDEELISSALKRHRVLISVEDGARSGGLGSAISEIASTMPRPSTIVRLGVPDEWVHHGSVDELKHLCGYDKDAIKAAILERLQK